MNVAGLDVHKNSIFCAIYNGEKHSEVKKNEIFTSDIMELADYLISNNVVQVAMESTSIYWIPVWNVLSDKGLEPILVNPYLIKQMPGRKSDIKDAQWIAELLYKKMIRASFIPDENIQSLRSYTRAYIKLQHKITTILVQMENILVQAGIRLSSLVTNIGGKSMMRVIEALIQEIYDPEKLAKLVYGNKKNKANGRLVASLTGCMREHHRFNLEMRKEEYDMLKAQSDKYLALIKEICERDFSKQLELLKNIPGVSYISAAVIIAETGGDMSIFESSNKLAGWAGLRPKNDESAGKYKSTTITKGNQYLKPILVQVAWAASRCKGTYFREKYNRLIIRKPKKKVVIAIARKIIVIAWNILKTLTPYDSKKLVVYDPIKVEAKMAYHQRELERLEKIKA